MKWLKAHKGLVIALALLVAWIIYRKIRGLSLISGGHVSPADAIAYGWSVYPRGITGWLEVSPDDKIQYEHDTGWAGDPYSTL